MYPPRPVLTPVWFPSTRKICYRGNNKKVCQTIAGFFLLLLIIALSMSFLSVMSFVVPSGRVTVTSVVDVLVSLPLRYFILRAEFRCASLAGSCFMMVSFFKLPEEAIAYARCSRCVSLSEYDFFLFEVSSVSCF